MKKTESYGAVLGYCVGGRFMLTIFGAVAELEREYILERQREGIEIAKANSVYKGRKPIIHAGFEAAVKNGGTERSLQSWLCGNWI